MNLLEKLRESGYCYQDKIFEDKSEYVLDIIKEWIEEKKAQCTCHKTKNLSLQIAISVYNYLLEDLRVPNKKRGVKE